MGDDRELQQTSIPIPDNESSQPSRPTAADLATKNVPIASLWDTPPPQADRESPRLNAPEIIISVLKSIIFILHLIRGFNKISDLAARFHCRIVILLMIWLLINLRVRSFRKKIILGSELWQWTLLIVIIFCGYSVIIMVTSLVVHYFTKACKKRYSAVYYAEGLRRSVNFTLLSILLVLTWHFYFRTDKGLRETKNTHVIFRVGKWTPICLLILSSCWLLKTWLLLKWKADAIFNRFSARMPDVAFQCYFLYGCILGAAANFVLTVPNHRRGGVVASPEFERQLDFMTYIEESNYLLEYITGTLRPTESPTHETRPIAYYLNIIAYMSSRHLEDDATAPIRGILLRPTEISTRETRIIAYYLKRIANVWPRDLEDDATSPIREILRQIFGYSDRHIISIEDLLRFKMVDEPDAQVLYEAQARHLYEVFREGNPSGTLSYETFENWAVTAHRSNLMLAFTLNDLSEVVGGLDKLMSGIAIITVIILWILLMDITTVTKLILVASPFLGGAFIFLDSFKPMLQGIIFTLMTHPFDVGDQCIIDEVQVEVKEIRIWSTKFIKIPGREELIHPNSVLVTKPISKFNLDPNDCIELNLDPTTDESQIKALENRINHYIKDSGDQFDGDCHMEIKGIENSIRLAVHFKHAKKTPYVSDSQFYEKKKTQRSELSLVVNQIRKEENIKAATK